MNRLSRKTRFASLFAAAMLALPFATAPRFACHYEGEGEGTGGGAGGTAGAGGTGDGGGAGGTGDGGGTGAPAAKPKKTYGEQEFSSVTRARDAAKKRLNALIKSLGRDPEDVTFVETGDPENPFTVEGIEDVIDAASKAGGDSEAKKRADADKKRRLLAPVEKKLRVAEKKSEALVNWIQRNAIVAPIRAACIAEKIVDDDGGQFSDVVALLKPRFKTTVIIDDDDATVPASVDILAMAEDSEDAIDGATGDPWQDARKMVAELARKRPKFKQSEFRRGPGAGGQNAGGAGAGGRGGVTVTPDAKRSRVVGNVAAHYGVTAAELGEAPINGG
jgi:hypothetical protein